MPRADLPAPRRRTVEAIEDINRQTWAGTDQLVARVVAESKNTPCWRPVRAAALHAMADVDQRRVWMTTEEFGAWLTAQDAVRRRWKSPVKPFDAIGMSRDRKLRLLRGVQTATKVEALACAHMAIGFDEPQPENFQDWFLGRFGGIDRVAAALDVTDRYLADRVRGYAFIRDERTPRAPEPALLRALDWLWRVGSVCPYGEKPTLEVYPR